MYCFPLGFLYATKKNVTLKIRDIHICPRQTRRFSQGSTSAGVARRAGAARSLGFCRRRAAGDELAECGGGVRWLGASAQRKRHLSHLFRLVSFHLPGGALLFAPRFRRARAL